MVRTKKVIPKKKKIVNVSYLYEVKCPHCGSFLQGGFDEQAIVYRCWRCNNPMKLDWDNCEIVENFK